jgi:hypothetical protein
MSLEKQSFSINKSSSNRECWEYLPKEISLIVLEFCGIVKNRNGKYMSQIAKNDVRYSVLLSIRKPRDSLGGKVYSGCCIIELRVDFKKTFDNIEYYFLISRLIAYDNEGKCCKILEFIDKWRKKKRISKGQYEYV